jgi:hypothetical protein
MQQQSLLQVGPHIILVILGVAALVLAIDFNIVYVALPVLSPGATATPGVPNGLVRENGPEGDHDCRPDRTDSAWTHERRG